MFKKVLSVLLSITLVIQIAHIPVYAQAQENLETPDTDEVATPLHQEDPETGINNDSEDNQTLDEDESLDQHESNEEKADEDIQNNSEAEETASDNHPAEAVIKKKDISEPLQITNTVENEEVFYGIALKDPTHVYKNTKRNNEVWKSYQKGSILKYRSYSGDWYQATVKVDGKWQTGYIHKSDVENAETKNQQQLNGIALQSPTKVFKSASTSAGVWKSYEKGSILKYRTFAKDWYQATVKVGGTWRTGYIHKSHVENAETSNQKEYRGIALQSPTRVYQKASTSAKVWKSYSKNSVLKYRSFSKNWYQATVYVKGKKQTGYIHKDHVQTVDLSKQEHYQGIALQSPTRVYQHATTSSTVLKSYKIGSLLKYRSFTGNWYEATVYVNGKRKTGYIHKNHVDNLVKDHGTTIQALAVSNPTRAYKAPSKSADHWKTYGKFSLLKLKTLSNNWYEATVYVKGKRQTAYFHKDDVTTRNVVTTKYNITFNNYVDAVMRWGTPKWDSAGKVRAVREEVEYYANPNIFPEGSPEFFQFLVLSRPAGLDPNEVNEKILKGKGVLSGKGKAFVDAAKENSINEIYLIQHALHETGHGTSTLAKGVPVDKNGKVIRDSKGNIIYDQNHPRYYKTVYNVFGYGAYDSNPIDAGAKYAFDRGWFSVEKAIKGGAKVIGTNWIKRGKDTLYKMKWSPTTPGTGQYATHVIWAVSQAREIYRHYQNLNTFTLIFDVPEYKSVPAMQFGKVATNGSRLNIRSGPSTSYDRIGSIPNSRIMRIYEQKNGWYRISYDGITGWVSGDFVTLLN